MKLVDAMGRSLFLVSLMMGVILAFVLPVAILDELLGGIGIIIGAFIGGFLVLTIVLKVLG